MKACSLARTGDAFLALLFSASVCFGQATVQFHIQDSFGQPLTLRKVTLSPVQNLVPATNNLGQVSGDFMLFQTDTNANATVTNVQPGTYRQVVFGPTALSTNYLLIPATTNTINARDWVTLYPSGLGFILYDEAGIVGGRLVFEP